ncbi:hypothetical protein ACFT8P_28310 [Streptomyces sp. NPDC057101]|uniref:hypothetical protein n=1 Tax=Streptomyces sp. NPDC057101 TaxID=3346020 RepID=UPI00362FFC8A
MNAVDGFLTVLRAGLSSQFWWLAALLAVGVLSVAASLPWRRSRARTRRDADARRHEGS